jgi:menaquinol-cytochrome c reductase iron-sulfur subunit
MIEGGIFMSEKVSRRQFLNYTLTGVGGFMAAGIVMPLARFAIDPVLKKEEAGSMVSVGLVKDLTNEPKRFDFKVHQVDGWVESEAPFQAWVYKSAKGDIIALSPVCKHLGCTVDWNGDKKFPNQFHCPCHGGRYHKDGQNIAGTPPLAPLDMYQVKVKGDSFYLGKALPQGGK